MKHLLFSATALALLLSGVTRVGAGIIYSNLGPGGTYLTGFDSPIDAGGQVLADQFTPAATATFTGAQLPLGAGTVTTLLNISLETDSSGKPGTILETISLTGLVRPPGSLVTVTSVLHPTLQAGTPYWLVVSAASLPLGTEGQWFLNSTGDGLLNGNVAFNEIGSPTGPWTVAGSGGARNAFEIDGNASATPEPATLTLLGIGIAAIAGYGWRTRTQKTVVLKGSRLIGFILGKASAQLHWAWK